MHMYTLTDRNREMQRDVDGKPLLWGPGVSHSAAEPVVGDWYDRRFRCYADPLLASLMARWRVSGVCEIPAVPQRVEKDRLWKVDSETGDYDDLCIYRNRMTTLRELPLVDVSHEQCVRFGVLSALAVNDFPGFHRFATAWLSGQSALAEADWIIDRWREGGRNQWKSANCAAYAVKHLSTAADSQSQGKWVFRVQCENCARGFAGSAANCAARAVRDKEQSKHVDFAALARRAMGETEMNEEKENQDAEVEQGPGNSQG